jgi:hypothetical protein
VLLIENEKLPKAMPQSRPLAVNEVGEVAFSRLDVPDPAGRAPKMYGGTAPVSVDCGKTHVNLPLAVDDAELPLTITQVARRSSTEGWSTEESSSRCGAFGRFSGILECLSRRQGQEHSLAEAKIFGEALQ